jgi:tRNA(Ile)-lysidine synthase TilS/MesJ
VNKNQKIVIGEFFAVSGGSDSAASTALLSDSFTLRLDQHAID